MHTENWLFHFLTLICCKNPLLLFWTVAQLNMLSNVEVFLFMHVYAFKHNNGPCTMPHELLLKEKWLGIQKQPLAALFKWLYIENNVYSERLGVLQIDLRHELAT